MSYQAKSRDDFYQSPVLNYFNHDELGILNYIQLGMNQVESFNKTYLETVPEELLAFSMEDMGQDPQPPVSIPSIDPPGLFYFPDSASHEPCDNDLNSYVVYSQDVGPAQYGQLSYTRRTVPSMNFVLPSSQYNNTSQTGYLAQPMYRTDWDRHKYPPHLIINAHINNIILLRSLYANSQLILPRPHIDMAGSNFDTAAVDGKQAYRELGHLPTSDYPYTQFEHPTYDHPSQDNFSTRAVESTTSNPGSQDPTWPAESYPCDSTPSFAYYPSSSHTLAATETHNLYHNLYPFQCNTASAQVVDSTAFNFQPSVASLPLYPSELTYDSSTSDIPSAPFYVNPTNSSRSSLPSDHSYSPLYPPLGIRASSIINNGIPSAPVPVPPSSRDISPSSSLPSLPSPITRTGNAPRPIPVRSPSSRHRTSPPKKLSRSNKKSTIDSGKFPSPRDHNPPSSTKQKRKSPYERVEALNTALLDLYFPGAERLCKICEENRRKRGKDPREGKKSPWREDRALEHLVHSHIFQVLKNHNVYHEETLKNPDSEIHLVGTEEQFEYARKEMNKIRCTYCRADASLVVRPGNFRRHLESHNNLSDSQKKEELKRLCALVPEYTEWYSYNDKFLFEFFSQPRSE